MDTKPTSISLENIDFTKYMDKSTIEFFNNISCVEKIPVPLVNLLQILREEGYKEPSLEELFFTVINICAKSDVQAKLHISKTQLRRMELARQNTDYENTNCLLNLLRFIDYLNSELNQV